jgi:hemoglobin/transferrin/lactoferrin receptor protein
MYRRIARRCGALLAAALLPLSFVPGPAAGQESTVTGQVLDAHTGSPVQAVTVLAGDRHTSTDQDGRFTLTLASPASELRFTRLGYEDATAFATAAVLRVLLRPLPVLMETLYARAPRGELLATGTALAVNHIAREALASSAGTGLAETLDGTEGVSVSRVGSWGSRAVLRGLTDERVAVLIDGNRVSRACTFGMDQGLATVDPATVERVEILSGPGSALYGSGNLGGVINVVTRRPALEDGAVAGEVRLRGSTAVPGGGLGVSLDGRVGAFVLGASVDGADFGDYESAAGIVEGSAYRQLTSDLKADWLPGSNHRLSFKGQHYAGRDIGWPMQGGAEIPEESRTSLSVDWGWQRGGAVLDGVSARAYYQKLDHHMVMSMIMPGMGGMPMTSLTDAISYSETSGARAQLRLYPASGLQLETGLEVTHLLAEGTRWTERQMGSAPAQEISFRAWPGVRLVDVGAFSQGEMELSPALSLTTGVRLDRVRREADTGRTVEEWIPTGNAGLRAAAPGGLSFRASLGAGYRTPDPMELYGLALKPDGFVYRGNAELDTERSLNAEVAVSLARGPISATITGFHNRLEDLVVFSLAGDSVVGRPVREYRNLGASRINGLSGRASATLGGGFSFAGNATWVRGHDVATGDPVPTMPPLEGGVSLKREFDGALRWIEAEWTGAARQERLSDRAGELATPGWAVTHLRAVLDVAGADLTVGVENLFDHLYRAHLDPRSLHRPGRNLFLSLSRSF